MSIIITKKTRVIVQGITGKQGSFHTPRMLDFGTNIVAGVVPGHAGQEIEGIPVYDSVAGALKKHKADFSVIFVPAPFAKDAVLEALSNGLHVVVITENIPVHDALEFIAFAKKKKRILIGPNCPGITSVGESKLGIMPNHIFKKGSVGIVSRSGTLTYEVAHLLTTHGIGQSTIAGIGGDRAIGLNYIEALKLFEKDPKTKKIILIGEIGGQLEEKAAAFIQKNISKPVYVYLVGKSAPKGKRMGHAGAVIFGDTGTYASKRSAFEDAGITVVDVPSEIVKLVKK